MTDILCITKLKSLSGDVDECENSWAFHSDVPGWPLSADFDNLRTALNAFYSTINSSVHSSELQVLSSGMHEFYDITGHLDGSPHGPPVSLRTPPAVTPSGDGLPGQIALVVEFNADLTGIAEFGAGTRPRSRRRGRHYHGPVKQVALEVDSGTKIPQWTTATMTAVKGAYTTLLGAIPTGVEWCVWSRKDAALHPVIGGWIDTTPHRARRREEPTNVKVLWP